MSSWGMLNVSPLIPLSCQPFLSGPLVHNTSSELFFLEAYDTIPGNVNAVMQLTEDSGSASPTEYDSHFQNYARTGLKVGHVWL